MNRNRMLILAGIALALSGVVTFLTYRLIRDRLRPADETTSVVVVTQRVTLGTRLNREQLRLAPWPKSAMLPGSFQDINAVADRGVIVPMDANEPVLESRLAPKNAGAGLTTAIPEGMRAVSIRVNDVIGVAGFVVPGTRVDVILTGQPLANASGDMAKTILENIQVLTAGQNVDSDANGRPQTAQVVTLLVTPMDSQKLALASTEGHMQLALRNPLDMDNANPPAVQRPALYFGPAGAPAAPAPAPVTPKPVRVVVAKPAPVTPPPVAPVVAAPPPPPRKFEVQLIQGKSSETVTFSNPQPKSN